MTKGHKHFESINLLMERIDQLKEEINQLESVIGKAAGVGKQFLCRLDTMAAEGLLSSWRKDILDFAHSELARVLTEGRSISFPSSLSHPTHNSKNDLLNWDAFKLAVQFEKEYGTAEDAEQNEALTNISNFIIHCKPIISKDSVILNIPFYHLEAEYSFMQKTSGRVHLGYSDSAVKTLDTIMAFFRLIQAIATNRPYASTHAYYPAEWQSLRQRSGVNCRDLYKRVPITGNNYARIMASRCVRFWMEPSIWASLQTMLPPQEA